jgi:hypothetical protein
MINRTILGRLYTPINILVMHYETDGVHKDAKLKALRSVIMASSIRSAQNISLFSSETPQTYVLGRNELLPKMLF